jgi:photosystem II stability/assembly factor-like uncharacterized protein
MAGPAVTRSNPAQHATTAKTRTHGATLSLSLSRKQWKTCCVVLLVLTACLLAPGVESVSSGRWLASGQGTNYFARSDDGGKTWTAGGKGPFTTRVFNAAHSGGQPGRWLAAGEGSASLAYSDDGAVSWTPVPNSVTLFSDSGTDVTYYPQIANRWLAAGDGGNCLAYSNDNGLSWTGLGTAIFSTYGGMMIRCNHLGAS